MERFTMPIAALMFAGCMSAAPKAPCNWTVECPRGTFRVQAPPESEDAKLLQLSVRAPYDAREFAVLRGDGSIAFDAFNRFAAAPALLLKGAAVDILESSGKFSRVVAGASSAKVPLAIEITVDELALDCRAQGALAARARVTVVTLRGRDIESVAHGEGRAAVGADGDFSRAFSEAFAIAAAGALGAGE